MKNRRAYIFATITLAVVWICGCRRAPAGGALSKSALPNPRDGADIEYHIKDRAIIGPSQPPAATATVLRSVQYDSAAGGPFIYPVSVAAGKEGGVYISDNNAHRIEYYPPDSDRIVSLPVQEEKGQLEWPNTLRLVKSSIFISDNDGIKIFKRDGSFQRLLRIYYQAASFAVAPDGSIFANPEFAAQRTQKPLIVRLNGEGKMLSEFGTRSGSSDDFGLEDRVFLCCAGEYLFAAFMYRPVVQSFALNGTLMGEFQLTNPGFDKLAQLVGDERFTHPGPGTVRLPRYVAGATAVGNRLLVLLDLPRLEVVEFNFQGRETARYRASYPAFPNLRYRGFDAQLSGNTYRFYTIASSNRQEDTAIVEYTAAKQG